MLSTKKYLAMPTVCILRLSEILTLRKAKPLLEKYLGSLPATPVQNSFKDVGTRMIKGPADIAIKRGKESQALLTCFLKTLQHTTATTACNLAALMEALNIEIIEKLREDMSGMYGGGMGGEIVKRPYEHYTIRASIPCGPENVEKLSKALLDIIKNAQDKGVAQKDLEKVKLNWKKQYHVNLQSNDFWLETLSAAFINGDNPENVLDYEQKIDAITAADLQKIAQRYLDTDKMITSVLYPEKSLLKKK